MKSGENAKIVRTVIFDLDQCLLQTRSANPEIENRILSDPKLMALRGRFYQVDFPDYKQKKGTGTNLHMWGVTRPHFDEVLMFCRSYFDIICVWSAGEYSYVHSIVEQIFNDIRVPDVIFTRDDLDYTSNGNYHKPIRKILEHPSIKGKATLEHSFFVDDMGDNFITSPGNGVVIPEYTPAPTISSLMTDDICLLQLRLWLLLDDVRNAPDVRNLKKSYIFISTLVNTPRLSHNMGLYSDLSPVRAMSISVSA